MADAKNQPNASATSANVEKKSSPSSSNSTKTKKAPQNNKPKRRQKKRKMPIVDQLHEDVCRVLSHCEEGTELKALTYALQPESEFMECVFEKIVFDIKNVLSQRFRNFEIHPFGSSVCGMAFKSERLDAIIFCSSSNFVRIFFFLQLATSTYMWISKIYQTNQRKPFPRSFIKPLIL